jgi:L-malate glycosyltransferase
MRVLYFTARDTPHDRRFLNALARTSHQIYALRQYACLPDSLDGITELSWHLGQPDWSDWRGWKHGKSQLVDMVAQIQPDLVHAGPVQGPALLTALAGFHPLVTMSWGSDLLLRAKRSPWMRFVSQYTLDRTDVFLGDCQTVLAAAASFGFPKNKMVCFPWGVDLEHFSPHNGWATGQALRESLGWQEKFIILCNRTWSQLYGVDVLATAFVNGVNENDDLRLILVGDGPQTSLIHKILAPVADKVSFPGWLCRNDLPGAYCAADLFVSPSHSDGSSISLLEALACGRPVLVSDIPSNREWVNPDIGVLFRDGDVTSLQGKLLQLAADPDLSRYGTAARMLAEDRADWQKNFLKLIKAYQMAVC